MRYPTLADYAVAVAEYMTGEFTQWEAWFSHERELATEHLLANAGSSAFIAHCFADRLLPSVPGECLVTGSTIARELASYSGSPRFEEV